MPQYRLYFLNFHGGIRRRLDMECNSDADAIKLVEERSDHEPVELWNGARFVRSFPASPQDPSA